jgi:hypothetical protein
MSHHAKPARLPMPRWISVLLSTFGASVLLVVAGVVALPLDWQWRGAFMIGLGCLAASCVPLGGLMTVSLSAVKTDAPDRGTPRSLPS